MPYRLDSRLVIGVASSAVFDLRASDEVFRRDGEEQYRKYQEINRDVPLEKGIAFSFIKRLLGLNDLGGDPENDPLVEVVLLSKNDPDTGMRVMRSIAYYNLSITRAVFMQGKAPWEYIPAFNIALFLSANAGDVRAAMEKKHPAGQVLESVTVDEEDDTSLRIAFDFDGVLANDESESIMQKTKSLEVFHEHEVKEPLISPISHSPASEPVIF